MNLLHFKWHLTNALIGAKILRFYANSLRSSVPFNLNRELEKGAL